MTYDPSPDEKRVIAWLRTVKGRRLSLRERLRLAWWGLRYGELVWRGGRIAAAHFIERGEHHD